MRRGRQQEISFPGRGGRRPGAGRKPTGPRAGVPHAQRPRHDARHPVHVTLRAVQGLRSLRAENVFPALRRNLGASSRHGFRVVHYSVQGNHLHLIVEADDKQKLARGMQGLGIRLAKAVNRLLGRCGAVWSDRYHARALRTPREVRNGLVYVLLNARKHGAIGRGIDPCSSGTWFDGWRERIGAPACPSPVARARTWLLTVGWRRGGLVSMGEAPAPERNGHVKRTARTR